MKSYRCKKKAAILCAAAIMELCTAPMQVSAAPSGMPSAGVATILDTELSVAEYINLARQARAAARGYSNPGISRVENDALNVREIPGMDGMIVGKMPKGTVCEIMDTTEDGWVHITSGQVEGYVREEYLLTGKDALAEMDALVLDVAVVNAGELNVRREPNTNCSVVAKVRSGQQLPVLASDADWVQVSVGGREGYVAAEYVSLEEALPTALTVTQMLYGEGVTDVRTELVEYAKQFLGNPYVWGGTSLTKGADCSGFVLSVFKEFGVELPHYSVSQSKMGTQISEAELLPGDLVFYSKNGTINHVAIYIGEEQVIHASNPETGIRISKYNYRVPTKYVRIL